MSKFESLRPILWTNNLEETILFYTSVLHFILDEKNDEWFWASLHKDDIEIMLSKSPISEKTDSAKFTGSFYINTSNIDLLWHELKNKAKICYEITNFDWDMREFAIYDNNGYILQFGQNINTLDVS